MPGRLNELVVVFVSIFLQSQPFVLLGVFASALVQRYLSAERLARWLPRGRLGVVLLASGFGFVAPVCDCGVIPLARRLGAKGLPLYAATTFILAAPVVNPVVLASTAVAFQGDWTIVGLRMAMSLSVALTVGLLAAHLMPQAPPLSRARIGGGGRGAARRRLRRHRRARRRRVFRHRASSSSSARSSPRSPRPSCPVVTWWPSAAAGSDRVAALMPVATLLSICSEADAFVARAFASTFSVGALLAFMTIGQIVDLRNGFLLVPDTAGARPHRADRDAVLRAGLRGEGWLINAALRP